MSALRSGLEDYKRHQADKARNGYLYKALGKKGFQGTRSGRLKPGTIIKINKNDMIPADVILLASNFAKGHAFIDKANLNGETALEVVKAIPEIHERVRLDEDGKFQDTLSDEELAKRLRALEMKVVFEAPNGTFDSFRGYVNLGDANGQISVGGKRLLMQETTLRNCDWVLAMVVYTGRETKIQLSNSERKFEVKKSKVYKMVDGLLVFCVLLQLCMCGAAAAFTFLWNNAYSKSAW